jgi:hypothetical protein
MCCGGGGRPFMRVVRGATQRERRRRRGSTTPPASTWPARPQAREALRCLSRTRRRRRRSSKGRGESQATGANSRRCQRPEDRRLRCSQGQDTNGARSCIADFGTLYVSRCPPRQGPSVLPGKGPVLESQVGEPPPARSPTPRTPSPAGCPPPGLARHQRDR